MDGRTILEMVFSQYEYEWKSQLRQAIDAAIMQAMVEERARCQAAIWEHRGKCASDEAAKALMEEMGSSGGRSAT